MLTELQIQNFALIRDLNINLHSGFNTITGETGTGKSIMLGALSLIIGNRADSSSLLDADRKCIVEGKFDISTYNLKSFFDENNLDYDTTAILRREINTNGKSRAFINDTPVTLDIMKGLGESLIDIHSQHQTIKITNNQFQLKLLDSFTGHTDILNEYAKIYRNYKLKSKQLSDLQADEIRSKKEYDFNLFQFEELNNADLKEGELDKLIEELNLLSHAEKIQLNLSAVLFLLYDDEQSVNFRFSEAKRNLSQISKYNEQLSIFQDRLESLLIENKDLSEEIKGFLDNTLVDNERLEKINQRIQFLQQLLNKHRASTEKELIDLRNHLDGEINKSDSITEQIQKVENEIALLHAQLEKLAAIITQNRQESITSLQEQLENLLREVGIPQANIKIQIKELSHFNESGKDEVDILFSANKGSKPEPISQVASGGELSRIMLCIKYILADSIFLPTIIFDEIDTGISGEVTIKVGQMMKKLSERHQIISITHQPQVAAMGAHQYEVYKISGEDFTSTHIKQLNNEERIFEIAKMIAGHSPSSLAIENAKELLKY